ncbi:hypothetical protein WQ13_001966 [Salmonella enterica subsp. enterica serovar Weltevreden]|nr:hypothetical protein [Salmonella enterica subsp. enterica serovar Weltevreden]
MTVRRILATAAALCLGGCITVYGPVKTGGQQQQGSQAGQQPGMSEQISTSFIGNRKPDELLNAVALYFREKAITASVNDQTTGIIAGTGDDPELSSLYLDCSLLPQTQNIQEHYRIVAQVWSAGEGSNVSVMVTGTAGLDTADGNDKVKPVECKSTGIFEKDLLERLRK